LNFHKTYNARQLEPREVAKRYIPNPDYDILATNDNTVLLGSRGCGKTTLMKMLTLPALSEWSKNEKNDKLSEPDFNTVYIPTDIYWNAQKNSYHKQLNNYPKFADVVSRVAVTTNVLYALCESFSNIIQFNFESDHNKEELLAQELINSWLLPETPPTIQMVRESLLKRTDKLNRIIRETVFNCDNDDDVEPRDFFFLNFDSLLPIAIAAFERIYDINDKKKWALCFDELELAPLWLQEHLFTALRSRSNQRFIYKLSASPVVKVDPSLQATPRQDVTLIKMWPHQPGEKYQRFSETLVNSILSKHFGKKVTSDQVFGVNELLTKTKHQEYNKNGSSWSLIKEEAENDESLKELLEKYKIDPKDPVAKSNKSLDQVLRKVKPIVYHRKFYSKLNVETQKRKLRSRKTSLFFGKEVIHKICDGNPRWLIGTVNEMLKHLDKSKGVRRVKVSDQSSVLLGVSKQIMNILKTIPESSIPIGNKVYTLEGMITEIGEDFKAEMYFKGISLEPKESFEIDEGVDDRFLKILELGLYQGAIVLLDPLENAFDFNIRGRKFRLAYFLHPLFRLPMRKGRVKKLSDCLTGKEAIVTQSKFDFNKK